MSMDDEYKLWEVNTAYPNPERIGGEIKTSYIIVAQSSMQAKKKADSFQEIIDAKAYFKESFRYIGVNKITSKISFPLPFLSDDRNKFNFSARLSDDGKSLEYVVTHK
jgi:hypothetical protein